MTTYGKTRLIIVLGFGTLLISAFGEFQLPKPWGFLLLLAGFVLMFLAGRIRCPQCGKPVSQRPWSLFGVPTTIGAGFLHTHCHFCGYDLRELAPSRR